MDPGLRVVGLGAGLCYDLPFWIQFELDVSVATEEKLYEVGSARPEEPSRSADRAKVLVCPLKDQSGSFWARAEGITAQGIFVSTRRQLAEDTLLILELVFPGLPVPKLRLDAHVVHLVPGAGFGCRFVAPSQRDARRLAEIVARMKTGDPAA